MGKDLEQTFPLSVSLCWSTDLGSRSLLRSPVAKRGES